MEGSKDFKWHLTAIVVVGIWGMTFISTRVLIENGLTPQEIFLLRFLIAYVGIRRRLDAAGGRDGRFALFSDGEYGTRSDAYHKCGFYCL